MALWLVATYYNRFKELLMMKSLSWVILLAIVVGCGESPPPKVEVSTPKTRPSVESGAISVERGH